MHNVCESHSYNSSKHQSFPHLLTSNKQEVYRILTGLPLKARKSPSFCFSFRLLCEWKWAKFVKSYSKWVMLSPDHDRKSEQPFMSSSHWLLQAYISPVSQKTWTLGINSSHDSKLVFYAQSTSAVISGWYISHEQIHHFCNNQHPQQNSIYVTNQVHTDKWTNKQKHTFIQQGTFCDKQHWKSGYLYLTTNTETFP